jgi:neutral ceramidase
VGADLSKLVLIFLLLSPYAWNQTLLQAGAARRDITPLEPVPMWGYGARHDKLSDGVLDPLYAAALVLQAGSHKIAIVGLDLGRSPNERSLQAIRKRILEEDGIESSFIAGSHTHHGPVLELSDEPGKGKGKFDATLRYYNQLEDAIVAAIGDANKKLAPAKMGAGSVQLEGFNTNRQTKLTPKTSDRELAVLRLDDAAGKPIAILVNFAAHPTLLPSSLLKFSADYAGVMKNAVARETGAPVLFLQGAGGDQSVERTGHSDHQSFGEALAREVIKLAQSIKTEEIPNPALTVREDRFQFGSRTNFKDPFTTMAFGSAFFPELVPNYLDEYKDGIRPRLTVAVLNQDIAFVGVSGEFFSNHALRLKERARLPHLFFLGYCNGYHQYFPTIEAVAEGGYGADREVSPVEIGAGEQIMNKALLWLYQMRGKIK